MSESDEQTVSWTQLHVLRAIGNGHDSLGRIRRVVRIGRHALGEQVDEMIGRGLIDREGLMRRLRLTPRGVDALTTYGFPPDVQPTRNQATIQRQEIRHTTNIRTGFSIAFGLISGLFVGWLLIAALSSIIYWAGYTFVLKNYVPSFLLPYVPLDNFLVDLVFGLVTATAVFLPLRRTLPAHDVRH
jgi:hypothetical protein